MQAILNAILNLIRTLLGGGGQQEVGTGDCLVSDVEIPAEQMPILTEEQLTQTLSAQAAGAMLTIKANLTRATIYTDANMASTPLVMTKAGASFELLEATPKDADGYRWFKVRVAQRTGWIRSELVTLNAASTSIAGITNADIPDPAPPNKSTASARFAKPVDVRINQGYSTSHRGVDLNAAMSTPVRAEAPGLVIRSVACEKCKGAKTNIYPCGTAINNDPGWGYGYGNFVVVRYNYAQMPPELRTQMDKLTLRNGFVYVLYAHFSKLNVQVGQFVTTGHVLGLTGNHGCSSAAHLHFEIRVGTVDIVDNVWAQQRPLNPNLMFMV